MSELKGNGEPGLHRISWNLTGRASTTGRAARSNRPMPNGTYRVVLTVDDEELPPRTIALIQDPMLAAGAIADEQYEAMLLDDERVAALKRKAKSEGRSIYQDD